MNSKPDNVTQSLTPGHNPGIRASGVTSLGSHDPVSGKTMQILSKPWIEEEDRPQAITEADAAELQLAALDGAASAEVATAQPAATIGAVDAPAAAAGAGAATLSPVAIGAGVLGVVAVAAAAGGSSGGGSSPAPQAPIASKPPTADKPSVTTDKPAASTDKPAAEKPENPGDKTEDQVKPTAESVPSRGTLDAPLVAESGNTRLNAASFEQAGPSGQKPAFIQIQSIQEKIDGGTRGAQVVRFGDDAPKTKDANPEAHLQGKLTAYEIIRADEPITRDEAIKMAEKLGGKLLAVDTAKEDAWLAANFFGALGAYEGDKGNEWAAQELQANGAWIGKHHAHEQADATIRGGRELVDGIKFFDHNSDKLSYFVVEYGDYQAPLLLIKDGQTTPVVAGQIIKADDVKHLVWNSDHNKGGEITFQAVTTNDPTTALPVEKTEARTLTINESPSVVANAPSVVANAPSVEAPANRANDSPANDASQGEQAAAGNTQSAPQDKPQDVEVQPSVKPVYSSAPVQVNVGLDKQHALASNLFVGSDAAKMPSAVKITELVENNDTKTGESALSIARPNAEAVPLSVNSTIQQADFDYVRWDSAQNEGGRFKFQALTAAGQPIQDATAQVQLHEKQQTLPQYPGKQPMLTVTHQGELKLESSIFAGIDNSKAPDYIRITQVLDDNKRSLDKALVLTGTDGNKTPVGEWVAKADFDKLSWDADHSNGGSFAFEAYDADKQRIHGAVRQTVTVYEQPASPTYTDSAREKAGAHDKPVLFDKAMFTGTGTPPPYIKITTIKPDGDGNKNEALSVVRGGVLDTPVKEGTIIARADFDYLRWEGDKQNGGTFTFQALDHQKNPLPGVEPQTITVTEAPAAVAATGTPGQSGTVNPETVPGTPENGKVSRIGVAGQTLDREEEEEAMLGDDPDVVSPQPAGSPQPVSDPSVKPAGQQDSDEHGDQDVDQDEEKRSESRQDTDSNPQNAATLGANGVNQADNADGSSEEEEDTEKVTERVDENKGTTGTPESKLSPSDPAQDAKQDPSEQGSSPQDPQADEPAGDAEQDKDTTAEQSETLQKDAEAAKGNQADGKADPGPDTTVSSGGDGVDNSGVNTNDGMGNDDESRTEVSNSGAKADEEPQETAEDPSVPKEPKAIGKSLFTVKSLSFDELLGGDSAEVEQGARSYEPVAVSHDLLNKPVADELLFTNGSVF